MGNLADAKAYLAARNLKPMPIGQPLPHTDSVILRRHAMNTAVRRAMGSQAGAYAGGGGYNGASVTRGALGLWRSMGASVNAETVLDLPALRARSNDLTRNAPVAAGAISTDVTHVVGTGLTLKPNPDAKLLGLEEDAASEWAEATLREFQLWAASPDVDVDRVNDFFALQRLVYRSTDESGDVFVTTPMIEARPNRPYRLALQVIEAGRVCNESHRADDDRHIAGIELDARGTRLAAHIADRHPGDGGPARWQRVEFFGRSGRRNVLHLFETLRPGQVRGVPVLAPVVEALKQISRYTEAELQAAVISGAFSVFIKMDPNAFQDLFDEESQGTIVDQAAGWDGSITPGKAVNLLPGEEPVSSNPGRPNAQFDPFVNAILTQIGMAIEIPVEVLTAKFQSSYSAARASLLAAWRRFRCRRDWLATRFCQPVYELWLEEAVTRGRIRAPGFFADPAIRAAWCQAQWIGDGPGSIDPEKEVRAAAARVDLGISTLDAESVAYDGVPWAAKHSQRKRENEERLEAGLQAPLAPPPGAAPAESAPAEPASDPAEPPEPDDATPAPAEEAAAALLRQVEHVARSAAAVEQAQGRSQADTARALSDIGALVAHLAEQVAALASAQQAHAARPPEPREPRRKRTRVIARDDAGRILETEESEI